MQQAWITTASGVAFNLSDPDPAAVKIEPVDVKNQDHYARWKIQPIEFIMANDIPFCEANIIKYVMRYPFKNGLEDLMKARDYLDRLIEVETVKKENPLVKYDFLTGEKKIDFNKPVVPPTDD